MSAVFKYTDSTRRVVSRINERGQIESCSVESEDFKKWLAAGNVPEPADPEPVKDYRELRLEAYRERGATETACIEAIIEYMAGKPDKMTALAAIRDSVKRDFPKP